MVRSKKNFLWILVSVICMLTSLFFVACGENDPYKDVTLTASQDSIVLYVGQSIEYEYQINNYFDTMDNEINFSIVDASSSSSSTGTSGEHVSLKVLSKNEDIIKVELTGVSSGRSSIIATTAEGYKQCVIDVNVLQYSKSFEVDSSKIMYASLGKRTYVSNDYFVFDEGTTEKNVKYYYVQDVDADLEGKEFTSVYFYDKEGVKTVSFMDKKGNTVSSQPCQFDGERFTFLAVYSYRELDETGVEIEVSIKRITSIVALLGIDENDVQFYNSIYDVLSYDADGMLKAFDKDSLSVELIANKVSKNSKTYYVTIPTIVDSIIDFGFEYSTYNKTDINIEARDVTNDISVIDIKPLLDAENLKLYEIKITSSSFVSSLFTNFNLNVFYKFDENTDFSSVRDESVNYSIDVPIIVKLMPEKIEVADENEVVITSDSLGVIGNNEKEVYYNFYVSDYGWIEYHVNVYKPSATYSGVKVSFDHAKINVIYDGKTFNTAGSFVMTDLSKPIYIRGVEDVPAGYKGSVNFEIQSELFDEGMSLTANLNYVIQDGASKISYTDTTYDPKTGNGVYVSTSSSSDENVFVDLYADKDFEYFVLEAINPGIVSIGNLKKDVVEGKHYLSMEIAPLREGEANYVVRLDNGVSTTLKVKVVNTFDDLAIGLNGTNEDIVLFEDIEVVGEEEFRARAIVRNTNGYSKTAKFEILSSYTDAISQVSEDFSNVGICMSNASSNMLVRSISTITKGETNFVISVGGRVIKKDASGKNLFKLETQTRKAIIEIVSYVPVSNVNVYNINPFTNTSTSAEKVVVYTEITEEENASNVAYLNVNITPNDSYYFFDVEKNVYSGTKTNILDYVYWTLSDGVSAFEIGATDVRTEIMNLAPNEDGLRKSYYIAGTTHFNSSNYYGKFEYDESLNSYKFSVNPENSSSVIFTIYATVRQYGLKKYYPVQIECKQFVAVEQIYLTDEIQSYSFENADEKLEFTVYLNPYEATREGIICVYKTRSTDTDGTSLLNVAENVTITPLKTTTSKAYIVTVQMSAETVNKLTDSTVTYSGILYVVPRDWYNSNYNDENGIKNEKLNQVIQIGIFFQNGTRANPYLLETAEDVMAIGSSIKSKQAHYVVNSLIDMSKVSTSSYPIADEFSGSIRGADENAGFTNINISKNPMFGKIIVVNDGLFSLDNLIFSGNFENSSLNAPQYLGMVAGECQGKVYNINVELNKNSKLVLTNSNESIYIGIAFGAMSAESTITQDFSRNYINIGGSLFSGELTKENGAPWDSGDKYFKLDADNILLIKNKKTQADGSEITVEPYVTMNGVDHELLHVSKTLVYAPYDFSISGNSNKPSTIYFGGVAGQINNGEVLKIDNDKIKHYNYSAYTLFANVDFSGSPKFVAGGFVGDFRSGTIDNALIGGRLYFALENREEKSEVVIGGIAGQIKNAKVSLTNITTRMATRGYTVGIIVGVVTTSDGEFKNIKVQAVDDGQAKGIDASFITRLVSQSHSTTNIASNRALLTSNLLQGISGSGYYSLSLGANVLDGKLYTYITRNFANYYTQIEVDAYDFVNSTEEVSDDDYYGDAILVKITGSGAGDIYATNAPSVEGGDRYTFTLVESGGLKIEIDDDKRFIKSTKLYIKADRFNINETYYKFDDYTYNKVASLNQQEFNKGTYYVKNDSFVKANTLGAFNVNTTYYTLNTTDYIYVKVNSPTVDEFNKGVYYVNNSHATYVYRYQAEAYYSNGVLVYSNIYDKQTSIDKILNTLYTNNKNFPFDVEGESISISTKSPNITIDANGNIIINATGIAEIDISTMLNKKNIIKIYLYVINYFDVESYHNYVTGAEGDKTQDLFYIDTLPLRDETEFNIIGDNVINVTTKTMMKKGIKLNDNEEYDVLGGGILSLNGINIQLTSANSFINYDVSFVDKFVKANEIAEYNEDETYYTFNGVSYDKVETSTQEDFDNGYYYVNNIFGQTIHYDEGFFFSKQANVVTTKDDFDEFNISAYLTFTASDGSVYTFDLAKINKVKANYFEGATALTSDYSSYPLITGKEFKDTFVIQSDTDEELIVELQDENGNILDENLLDDSKAHDVIINAYDQQVTKNGNPNCFEVITEINKESTMFKNRLTTNIYGTYYLKVYSLSRGRDGVSKMIKINFEEQKVNTITMSNYNDFNKVLIGESDAESRFVVPNQAGLLAMSIAPIDADFDYIVVENDEMNYKTGSAVASLVAGYIMEVAGQDVFVELGKINSTSRGIQISKEAIDQISGFEGNFYVKYLFGTNKAENKAPATLIAKAYKDGEELCVCSEEYQLNIKYEIGLKLNGYENKTRIARGLTYDLEVINTGYDAETLIVSIPEKYSNVANLIDAEGNVVDSVNMSTLGKGDVCRLQISNNKIDYSSPNSNKIEINIKAKYTNSLGELKDDEKSLELEILEFVVNYDYLSYEADDFKDIISGMANGVITTAIGEKTTLSVDFNNYKFIEYNVENTEVKAYIQEFITALDRQGTWMAFVDVNAAGAQTYPNPIIDKNKSYEHRFGIINGISTSLSNIYFSNSGLSFRTKRTHSVVDTHYLFTYESYYYIENGRYNVTSTKDGEKIYTEFTFDSFVRGSEENPNPVETYAQLKEMKAGGHYILMNDLYITSDNFEPIDFTAASFDGNGYKFIFSNYSDNPDKLDSVYDMSEFNEIGIFSSIAENCVVKNVTIQIGDKHSQNVIFNAPSQNAVSIGLVAVSNRGIITNACVENYPDVVFRVENNSNSSSFLGGIVSSNESSGYITHSRSYLSVECAINVGGVVGQNSGYIASSFFKDGEIKNVVATSTSGIYVAGFAVVNSGTIVTSYTSGSKQDLNYTSAINWATLTDYNIDSSVQCAGFVYKNNSDTSVIRDCYSNLVISSTNLSSGFVFDNAGLCENAMSYSLIKPSSNRDYGFAGGASVGSFVNCYYLRSETYNINKAQNFITIQGVEIKMIENDGTNEFNIMKAGQEDDFSSFIYSTIQSNNFVWYFNSSYGRLELVDANIIAFSQRDMDENATIENEDGTYTYFYQTSESSTADGSLENPYIITNAEKFQSYLAYGSSSNKHYRIVADIDFTGMETNYLTTYDTTFEGYLYGNGMDVANFNVYSDETLEYAGLFAQIVGKPTAHAFVKDLSLLPTQVTFVNTNFVGGLAGGITYADITNINLYGSASGNNQESEEEEVDENLCVVIGKNIVGGIVGIANEKYSFNGVVSKISTMSKHIQLDSNYIIPTREESSFISSYKHYISYSGTIAGMLAGTGSLNGAEILSSSVVSIGSSAGLMFGFIGKYATVENLVVNMNSNMIIRANVFGGLVTGGNFGQMSNIEIKGRDGASAIFSKTPYIPRAVGGVIGYMSGGNITNVNMTQPLVMPYDDGLQYTTVQSAGGIIGEIGITNSSETNMSKLNVNASITAGINLGGVVGLVGSQSTVKLSQVAVQNVGLTISSRYAQPTLGGIIGLSQGNIYIDNAYSKANLTIDVFEYESLISAAIGEVFGNAGANASSTVDLNLVKYIKNVYTNNTYSIRMIDKSTTDSAKTFEIKDDEHIPVSYVSASHNVFNETKISSFVKIISGENLNHQLRYAYLNSQTAVAEQNIENFVSALGDDKSLWIIVMNEADETKVDSFELAFI